MSVTPAQYRRVVLGAGIMLAVIIVSGAAVRLTASGLGCSDWPTCTEDSFAPEWSFHGWVEFGNRLFTGVVSAAVVAAVLAAYFRQPRSRRLIRLAWGLVAGVVAQIIIGAFVVQLHLTPVSVTVHFLLSMFLLANAIALYRRADPARLEEPAQKPAHNLLATGHLVLGLAVLVTGTIVTGTGPNSGDARADRMPFDLTQVARIHSIIVWMFIGLTLYIAVNQQRQGRLSPPVQGLLVASVAQGAMGYLQYFSGVPPLLVQLHIVGSIVVWCYTVWLYLWSRENAPPAMRKPANSAAAVSA